nr:reverse transcriptase [Tanacetum cinerariifolium]
MVETDTSDDTWAGCLKAIQNGKELLKLDIDGNKIPQSQPSELALLSNEQNSVLETEKYDVKLCKYISGTFSQAEKNYSTHEKETLACLRTLKKWKIDLLETRFELRTDSKYVTGSSKIGSGPGRTDKDRINNYSKNLLIYSHFQENINEVQIKALADFEDQFETFSRLLAPLPEDLKQLLCGYLSRTPRHHCQHCYEGINIPMTED